MKQHEITVRKDQRKIIRVDEPGEYVVELVGEGAEAEIVGAIVGKGRARVEIKVEVRHKAKNTKANTHIRGVVKDEARAKVAGLIKIFAGGQKTSSFLTEKMLILSDKARAEVVPELEIEADDVKASHAATVGRIDPEQVFYLMSRGLRRSEAESIIVEGFLKPVKP